MASQKITAAPNVSSFPLFLSYLVGPPLLPPLQKLQLLPQALVPAQAAHAYQGRHEASLNFPPKSISGHASAPSYFTVSLLSPLSRAKWGLHCTRRISAPLALTRRRRRRDTLLIFTPIAATETEMLQSCWRDFKTSSELVSMVILAKYFNFMEYL